MPLVVAGSIELRTNDPSKIVRLAEIEKFHDGGYRSHLTVVSGGFTCARPFDFDDAALAVAIPLLRDMATGAAGKCMVKGLREDSNIRIESNELGHVVVSGKIVEHSERVQSLEFVFRTDQTILAPLANELNCLREAGFDGHESLPSAHRTDAGG